MSHTGDQCSADSATAPGTERVERPHLTLQKAFVLADSVTVITRCEISAEHNCYASRERHPVTKYLPLDGGGEKATKGSVNRKPETMYPS